MLRITRAIKSGRSILIRNRRGRGDKKKTRKIRSRLEIIMESVEEGAQLLLDLKEMRILRQNNQDQIKYPKPIWVLLFQVYLSTIKQYP